MCCSIGLIAILSMSTAPSGPPIAPASPKVGPTTLADHGLHLPVPAEFPQAAREALRQRMAQHADELEWLLSAVLMLNYNLAERSATNLANDPKLAQPTSQDLDTLNALLPKQFFQLQAVLAKRARAVAVAAHEQNDRKLGRALGKLTETCVACHSVYLYGAKDDSAPSDD